MAVSFVSNCHDKSERIAYLQKLLEHGLQIDIYGKCATKICKNYTTCTAKHCVKSDIYMAAANVTNVRDDCMDVLDSDYKFYLSFENSMCDDYVTEKSLDLILRHAVVPVIRNGANKTLFYPPQSFIDTDLFKNTAELVRFLKYLDKHISAYERFFDWREHYHTEIMGLQNSFCELCKRLNNDWKYTRLYGDIFGWMNKSNEGVCYAPSDII